MLRLFVALIPPRSQRAALLALPHNIADARWQDDAQLHLTLAFVGEVDERAAADLDGALSALSLPAVDLAIAGVGHFARRGRVHSLWAGAAPAAPLTGMSKSVAQACRIAGLDIDSRQFVPHVTLARLNADEAVVAPFLAAHADLDLPAERVTRMVLMQSDLGKSGARYSVLAHYPLARQRD